MSKTCLQSDHHSGQLKAIHLSRSELGGQDHWSIKEIKGLRSQRGKRCPVRILKSPKLFLFEIFSKEYN